MLGWGFNNQQSKNELSIVNFKAIGLLEVQNSSSITCILVSRLESTWGPRKNGGDEKYHYAKNFKRWSNPCNVLDIKDSNTSRQNTIRAREQVAFTTWTSSRRKGVKGGVDDNKNHRGQGGCFSSWTQLTSRKKSKCWRWSWHICREFPRECNRTATASSRECRSGKS